MAGPEFLGTWDDLVADILTFPRHPDDSEADQIAALKELRELGYLVPHTDGVGWMLAVPERRGPRLRLGPGRGNLRSRAGNPGLSEVLSDSTSELSLLQCTSEDTRNLGEPRFTQCVDQGVIGEFARSQEFVDAAQLLAVD